MHQNYTWATHALTQPAMVTGTLGWVQSSVPWHWVTASSLLLLALLLSLQLPQVSPSSWKYTPGWEGQFQCFLCSGECSSTNSICRFTTHSCYSASGGTVATQPVVPFNIRGQLTQVRLGLCSPVEEDSVQDRFWDSLDCFKSKYDSLLLLEFNVIDECDRN